MPRKLRELRRDPRREGYRIDRQRGSPQVWQHPDVPGFEINLAGADGADAHQYQERDIRGAVCRARSPRNRGGRMTSPAQYSIVIEWSPEDAVYVVSLPEWGQFIHTHGDTREEALRRGEELVELLIEGRRARGAPLPEPRPYAVSA